MATRRTGVTVAPDRLAHVPAWRCGAAGGAISALAQFIGNGVGGLGETLSFAFRMELTAAMYNATYFLVAMALTAICGAAVAFFLESKTQNRWTLFLAGIAATSIGTMALPGIGKVLIKYVDLAPISSAYAQTQPTCPTPSFSISIGLKQFFRIEDPKNYRVVVGSFKNLSDAQALVNRINASDTSLHPFVADKYPGNDFYAVIAGPSSTTLDEAQKIQNKVLTLDYIPGAFISRWGC
jgi:hypothetical protein